MATPSAAILSLFLATVAFASALPQVSTTPDTPQVDNEGGADGTDQSAYSLSQGGLIAIIVVVVAVVVIGVATTVLFFVAKRRQWEVRKTLKRASRRVTARLSSSRPGSRSASRADRRGAVRMQSPGGSKNAEKRGAVQMTGMPPTPSGLRTELKAPIPKERVEAAATTNADTSDAGDNKRWKAILPPTWSMKGKA